MYCEAEGTPCAPHSCAGATAWGWAGDLETAGAYCLDAYHQAVFPLNVECNTPLEGLATMLKCCCEYD